MLKKIIIISLLISGILSAETLPFMYVSETTPFAATEKNISGELKKGESFSGSYFWLFSLGDASIREAAKNGGIKNIVSIDKKQSSFAFLGLLGVYKYTTIVYGY